MPLSLSNSLAASRLPQRSIVRFTSAAGPSSSPLPIHVNSSTSFDSQPSKMPAATTSGSAAAGRAGDARSDPVAKRRKTEGTAATCGWTCPVCTLENAAASARCDACETPRKDPTPAAAAINPATPSPSAIAPTNTFTVLTLNVWFDSYHDVLRMRRVIFEVRRLQPDFLCLQEVTPQLLSLLEPLLIELGYRTQSVLRCTYGEMLWWRAASVSSVQLSQDAFQDSQQGRQLHVVRCVVRGRPLAAATVHLESEAQNCAVRLAQLGRTLQQLQGMGIPFVLAGDTNLGKKDDVMLSRNKTMMSGANDGAVLPVN